MSADGRDDGDARRKRREQIAKADYDVGYGKPPVETRFGQGGYNPSKGRALGSKNKPKISRPTNGLFDRVLKHGDALVRVTDQNGTREVPRIDAGLSAVFAAAAKGDVRAAQLYFHMYGEASEKRQADISELWRAVIEYRFAWEQDIKLGGEQGPGWRRAFPHPDDLVVDAGACRLVVKGPSNEEEFSFWGEMLDKMDDVRSLVEWAETMLDEFIPESTRKFLKNSIGLAKARLSFLQWWFAEYDGGPRCPHGHTPDEILQAIAHFGLPAVEPVIRRYV